MARVTPKLILNIKDGHKNYNILEADGVYSVLYDGKPVNIKNSNFPGHSRYMRTSYPSAISARIMAEKLNRQFNTDKFKVYKMEIGEPDAEEQ